MKRAFLVLLIAGLVSCGKSSEIKRQIGGSDSLVINFNKSGTDFIDKTVTTTEKNAIRELSGFVDTPARVAGTCTLDGNVIFYKGGEIKADVSFTYSIDSCRQFILKMGDRFVSTEMSNKAVDFLKSLKEGTGFY